MNKNAAGDTRLPARLSHRWMRQSHVPSWCIKPLFLWINFDGSCPGTAEAVVVELRTHGTGCTVQQADMGPIATSMHPMMCIRWYAGLSLAWRTELLPSIQPGRQVASMDVRQITQYRGQVLARVRVRSVQQAQLNIVFVHQCVQDCYSKLWVGTLRNTAAHCTGALYRNCPVMRSIAYGTAQVTCSVRGSGH